MTRNRSARRAFNEVYRPHLYIGDNPVLEPTSIPPPPAPPPPVAPFFESRAKVLLRQVRSRQRQLLWLQGLLVGGAGRLGGGKLELLDEADGRGRIRPKWDREQTRRK